jgi:hypothetical protein
MSFCLGYLMFLFIPYVSAEENTAEVTADDWEISSIEEEKPQNPFLRNWDGITTSSTVTGFEDMGAIGIDKFLNGQEQIIQRVNPRNIEVTITKSGTSTNYAGLAINIQSQQLQGSDSKIRWFIRSGATEKLIGVGTNYVIAYTDARSSSKIVFRITTGFDVIGKYSRLSNEKGAGLKAGRTYVTLNVVPVSGSDVLKLGASVDMAVGDVLIKSKS